MKQSKRSSSAGCVSNPRSWKGIVEKKNTLHDKVMVIKAAENKQEGGFGAPGEM